MFVCMGERENELLRKVGGLQEKEVYAMKVDNQTGKDNYAVQML